MSDLYIKKNIVDYLLNSDCSTKFYEYCQERNIDQVIEIEATDFVAFRKYYSIDQNEIIKLKNIIINSDKNDYITDILQLDDIDIIANKINERIEVIEDSDVLLEVINKNSEAETYAYIEKNVAEETSTNLESDITINQFDEYTENHMYILIDELGLSVRAYNCLKNNDIKTLNDLLFCSDDKLMNFENLGRKTFEELKKVINKNTRDNSKTSLKNIRVVVTQQLKNAVGKLFDNDDIDIILLNDYELDVFNQAKEAIDEIGNEICLHAYIYPKNFAVISSALYEFAKNYDESNEKLVVLEGLYNNISNYILKTRIFPYISAYTDDEQFKKTITDTLNNGNCEYIYQINSVFKYIVNNEKVFICFCKFISFLNIDINTLITNIFDEIYKNDRIKFVIECRANGDSLEKIGETLSVTRERVRQIELKAQSKFDVFNNAKKILLLLCAVRNGDYLITESEIGQTVSRYETELTYLLKNSSSTYYHYNKYLGVFTIGNDFNSLVDEFLCKIPNYIFDIDLDNVIKEIERKENIPEELLRSAVKKNYRLTGKLYHKTNISLTQIYRMILKKYYPHGMKLFEKSEIERFRNRIIELFGTIKLPANNRAIEARVGNIGVLYDRGTYIHEDYINITDDLINKIDYFIENNSRNTISFLELFEFFKDELLITSNVSNRYFMQGVLKFYFGNKYYFSKDNISKDKNTKIDDEVVQFIEENVEVSKAEINSYFNGISEAMLLQIVSRNKEIIGIDNALYISSSSLDICEEDYNIINFIKNQIIDTPISSRKLFDILSIKFSDFLLRNGINSHTKLFGIFKFMFSDKLKFSRPFIGNIDDTELSNIGIVKNYIQNLEIVKIDEIISFCDEQHLRFLSWASLLQQLSDEFIRKDENELISVEKILLDDIKIQQLGETIESDISTNGYLSAKNIDSFLYYPDIGVQWNGFLLSSIIKGFVDTVHILYIPTTDTYALNSVFIDGDLDIDSYEDFLKWLIKSEHTKSPFSSLQELKEWLSDEGVINVDLPKFITETQFVYQDEYGKIVVQ